MSEARFDPRVSQTKPKLLLFCVFAFAVYIDFPLLISKQPVRRKEERRREIERREKRRKGERERKEKERERTQRKKRGKETKEKKEKEVVPLVLVFVFFVFLLSCLAVLCCLSSFIALSPRSAFHAFFLHLTCLLLAGDHQKQPTLRTTPFA